MSFNETSGVWKMECPAFDSRSNSRAFNNRHRPKKNDYFHSLTKSTAIGGIFFTPSFVMRPSLSQYFVKSACNASKSSASTYSFPGFASWKDFIRQKPNESDIRLVLRWQFLELRAKHVFPRHCPAEDCFCVVSFDRNGKQRCWVGRKANATGSSPILTQLTSKVIFDEKERLIINDRSSPERSRWFS